MSGEGLGPVRVDTIQGGPGYSGMRAKQPTVDIASACAQYTLYTVQPGKVPGISYQQCAQDTVTLCAKMHLAVEIYYILSSSPMGPGNLHWVGA